MAVPKDVTWKIGGPHTKVKHEILRRYLQAWFPILSTHHGRIIYIDGFCGPGRYDDGEPGSPVVALEVAKNHRQIKNKEIVFWFVDSNQERINYLSHELRNISIPGNFKIEIVCGKFQEELEGVLDYLDKNNLSLAPTFAFIDPFGFSGIPFALIKRLLAQKGREAFINLNVEAINRFIKHPKDKITRHIVDAFGTEKCINVAEQGGDIIKNLRTLYQAQLKSIVRYVRYFEMRDKNGQPIYVLFFASKHRLGHIKMKEAMWRVDPGGDFVFSDATDPDQRTLFKDECIVPNLTSILENKYSGKGIVGCKNIHEFVEDETAFLETHMKRVLKELEASAKIRVEPIKTDNKKRRAGSFPDEVRLTFI